MSRLTKILTMTLVVVTMLLVSVTGTVFANERIEGPSFDIEVAPNVLNIESYGIAGNIHSNIPVTGLTVVTLEVNGTGIAFTRGTDSLGHLVINFDMAIVKDILAPEGGEISTAANFILTCFYDESYYIIVVDSVPVISVP